MLYQFIILETIPAGRYLYDLNCKITHNAHIIQINKIIHNDFISNWEKSPKKLKETL